MPNSQDQDQQEYQDYLSYQAYQAQHAPGVMNDYVKPALGLIGAAANKVDSYTGAPTRAALGAAENVDNLRDIPGAAWDAAKQQFGADPSAAPTGKQLLSGIGVNIPETAIPNSVAGFSPVLTAAKLAGFRPTYNDVAGAGVEAAANPLNAIPGFGEAKGVESAAEIAPEVSQAAKASGVPSIMGRMSGSVGETFTGQPKAIIQHYYDNTDKINDLIKTYGQDTAHHAIDLRNNWNQIIQNERNVQNGKIEQALRSAPKDPNIDVSSIIDHLEHSKAALNPVRHSDAIAQIDDQIDTIKKLSQKNVGAVQAPGAGGAASVAAGLNDVRSSYGMGPDYPTSSVSGKSAKQLPSLPRTRRLSDVQQFAQDAGLQPQMRIPPSDKAPWPSTSQAPASEVRSAFGLPPENTISGPANPESIANSSNAISAANSAKFNPYDFKSPESFFANEAGLHEIVKDLQMRGQGAYPKAGEIFSANPAAASASKNAGGLAREILINEGRGVIPAANKQLQALHHVEDTMNPNLLKPEGAPNALFRAATNPGGFEANSLKKLGQITGHDFISDAKDFATAQSMANSPMLPVDVTGKAVARQNLGKAIGGAVGGGIGYFTGGYKGAAAGGYLGGKAGQAATSPAALKAGINAVNSVGKIGPGLIDTVVPASRGLILGRPAANGLIYGQGQGDQNRLPAKKDNNGQ